MQVLLGNKKLGLIVVSRDNNDKAIDNQNLLDRGTYEIISK